MANNANTASVDKVYWNPVQQVVRDLNNCNNKIVISITGADNNQLLEDFASCGVYLRLHPTNIYTGEQKVKGLANKNFSKSGAKYASQIGKTRPGNYDTAHKKSTHHLENANLKLFLEGSFEKGKAKASDGSLSKEGFVLTDIKRAKRITIRFDGSKYSVNKTLLTFEKGGEPSPLVQMVVPILAPMLRKCFRQDFRHVNVFDNHNLGEDSSVQIVTSQGTGEERHVYRSFNILCSRVHFCDGLKKVQAIA